MSLLGKPINYKSSRRDMRYRRIQAKIYNFLERPRGYKSICYHLLVFLTIFLCLTLSVLSTVDDNDHDYDEILFAIEIVVVIWFSIEYCLRVWSSGCRSRYQGAWGRLKYAKRPFCIIDVVTVLASVVVLAHGSAQEGGNQVVSAVRSLRFFQILRMVRMDRRGGTWKLLGSVVYAHRQELITTLYIGFLGLIFSSFLVYLVEKDENPKHFKNFPDALWWGVITLCTVGYGDVVPTTWEGKVIASGCALLGITFFALPAGILGSGFALKVQQQQRQKHMIRRRQPAASLIQCLWRCYAADENSCSVATWKIHQVPLPSPPSRQPSSLRLSPGRYFKHNASFVTRLPTIRRHRNAHSPSIKGRHVDSNHALDNMANSNKLNASQSEDSMAKDSTDSFFTKKNSDDEDEDQLRVLQLTPQHKGAIRSLRKIKYFVARRKFKEALKPYDVKDVIEQYSSGHADLLTRVKFLHGRLDQILGKQGSKSKDVYESKLSLASRIVKIERQVDDVESKLDQLIDLYMEDRKRLLLLPALPSNRPDCSPPDSGGPGVPHHHSNSFPQNCGIQGVSPNTSPGSLTHPYHLLNQNSSTSLSVPHTNTVTSVLKPKPILVDKQASEPNTPTSKNFDRPMTRGNSDISYKMKKRVTLSSLPSRHSLETRDSDYLQVPQIVHVDHNSSPYLDEDNESVSQDENCSTLVTDCDSMTMSDMDSIFRDDSLVLKDEHPTIKEEPAFFADDNDIPSDGNEIPTISASLEVPVVAPTTPTLRLFGDREYSPPHHPHLQHHQPSSQRRPSFTSSSSSLVVAEASSSKVESFELQPTETASFLFQNKNHRGSTAICIEDTSS